MTGEAARDRGLRDALAALPAEDRARLIAGLGDAEARELLARWDWWAHPGQIAPAGDWRVWLVRAGRGFGKTRAGAEWLGEFVRRTPEARVALVGATAQDVRQVMIEGPSGLIATARADARPAWRPTLGEVHWPNGAVATVYSAAAPEGLRGPEHHAAWCDELAKWTNGEMVWDNLLLTMRLGERPRVMVTTTPRPTPLMRRIIGAGGTVETRGGTADNPHLPAAFVAEMTATYGGTRLGRQELDGEMIEDVAGALWTRATIEACRAGAMPDLVRVVIGVDPPAGTEGDACGIVAVGLGADDNGYVIADASVSGATPEGWARAVADCAARVGADRVVAEVNQGGAMVRSVLMAADAVLPVREVRASRGKSARAEPVAALYTGGRVFHAGAFPALEDELCGLTAGGGYEGPGRSPDRADALVWALTELMLGPRGRGAARVVVM